MNFSSITILGRLTRDPEFKIIGESMLCNFGIAYNRRVKKSGEWVDAAVFLNGTIWGKQAEAFTNFLSKGDPVLVSGELGMDTWEKEGEKKTGFFIAAQSFTFVTPKPKEE